MPSIRILPLVFAIFLAATTGPASGETPESRFAEMVPDEVTAFEKEVLRQVADLALIPPNLNTAPLPEYDYDQLDFAMNSGIARTPGGRLWAAWIAGYDGPEAFLVAATSDDDGDTWSKPRLVIDSHSPTLPMDRSVIIGNFWTDPLGRLWIFFDQSMHHFDGRGGLWAAVCDDPDADEPTWSDPRRIWHGSMLNKPTVLSTGEWMLPVQLLVHRKGIGPFVDGVFPGLDPLRGANVFVSSDQGETWERRGMASFPNPSWFEHMIVEMRDGSLWMLARTTEGMMQSFSKDGGRTWSEATFPEGIKHPAARFHVRRLASDRILLIKHGEKLDVQEGRSKITAWLSDDEGKTWQGGLMLDERRSISYPDGFQAPDGTIYLTYDHNRTTDAEIYMARFTEEDVLAKELSGPKSRLRILVSRAMKGKENATPTP
jgi:hypothetical protein